MTKTIIPVVYADYWDGSNSDSNNGDDDDDSLLMTRQSPSTKLPLTGKPAYYYTEYNPGIANLIDGINALP